MNLVVVLEHRFFRTPDGFVWTPTTFAYNFWQRYLEVFDSVRVVARVKDVPSVPDRYRRADGENVSFAPIPYYVGPWQFLIRLPKVKRAVQESVTFQDAVILRVPSTLANLMVSVLRQRKQPFALEVVGDPWDVFSPGAVRYFWPVRMFARWWFTRALEKQCKEAAAVAYVTRFALQQRYPPGNISTYYSDVELSNSSTAPALGSRIVTHYSSVELASSAFADDLKTSKPGREPFTLITVATLDQLYKGVDVLIDAVAFCVNKGLDVHLVVVGDGKYRPYLEARCRKRGVEGRVRFLGQLPAGEPVYTQLDRADLFILASRQEGLPRAMLEAMARGLPCIGTTVGGIPELLPSEDLVPPGDASILAAKIKEVLTNPERMERMALRNSQKAREYREEILRERRLAFYRAVRELTEEWWKKQQEDRLSEMVGGVQ